MKETGIIMSGDHPKLILDGIKTQTRRVIKPQPTVGDLHDWEWKPGGMACSDGYFRERAPYHCPYGQVGQRLWVRETWAIAGIGSRHDPDEFQLFYKADGMGSKIFKDFSKTFKENFNIDIYHSPRFMPRWASRILLEITEIRAERVQEITEEDAFAEGCKNQVLSNFAPNFDIAIRPASNVFKELWDSLNAKRGYGWDRNNWVFPISFRLVSQ